MCVFEGLHGWHSCVVGSHHDENRRVGLCCQVLVGGVAADAGQDGLAGERITPFGTIARRERQVRVDHGREDVNEWGFQDGGAESFGCLIEGGCHEGAAGAAADERHVSGGRDPAFLEVVQATEQVREGVGLVEDASAVVPCSPLLAAAADMCDGVRHPVIDEGGEKRIVVGGSARSVGSVGREEERTGGRAAAPSHHSQGNAHPGRRHRQMLFAIGAEVVSSQVNGAWGSWGQRELDLQRGACVGRQSHGDVISLPARGRTQ